MVVLRAPGEVFLLRHTFGPDAHSWVERIDPVTLEPLARSDDLAGGPTWPGGLAAHANGSLYVVFGNHAHRLSADLRVLASRELPRRVPYNSFVILPDGHLVTKDFGGLLPGHDPASHAPPPAELLVLEPETLRTVGRCDLPEPSVARLSADGEHGVRGRDVDPLPRDLERRRARARPRVRDSLPDPARPDLRLGRRARARRRVVPRQRRGQRALRGHVPGLGVSAAPLHLVRVDLDTAAVSVTEICGAVNGLIANPPIVDGGRRIVVGYDSSNGVVAAFDIAGDGSLTPRWRREQHHACHPLLFRRHGRARDERSRRGSHGRRDRRARHRDRSTSACGSTRGSACSRCSSRPRDSTVTSTACSFTTLTRVSRAT